MARSSDRTETRIGHDARAAATGTLDAALREGRLDLAEYERRLMVIQAAKVGSDLTPAITDLPSRHGQRGSGLRISTVDREEALIRLAEALSDGRIEAAEYVGAEELVRRAVVYADVDAVVGDLDARASLAERQQAIERIEAAVAEGLLDPAEQHGRVEAVRNATSDAQLAALVADLTTSSRSPTAPARVSNVEREAVAARLYDAVEAGFLDLTEFDERVRAVYAARLSSELERLVADLPEPAPPPAPLPAEPPVAKPRREWRAMGLIDVCVYSLVGVIIGGICATELPEKARVVVTVLVAVVWLIGLVVLVKRSRRPVVAELPAESAPREENSHDEELLEQVARRTEQLEQLTEKINRMTERAEQVTIQCDQLPELLEQLPPKLAGQIARKFRKQRLSERWIGLTEQSKPLWAQIRQLPDQVEQVPPGVVEYLTGQIEPLLEQYEQLAVQFDLLTEQATQSR
ncbi:DUF1707 domain-containing protein [Actinophytocola sp.]|uniref:DUF1707 domain-containing protein n=1 Tax=Actinophytocola sp. TaxID=1872138 RepID=UPI002ECFF5D3